MPSLKSTLAVLAMTLVSSGNAHMLMASPPPYGNPTTSPLAADGSDFPCKSTSSSGGPVTDMTIGSQLSLTFNGTAVHGGGSCQISLTTDNPATKSSKWMVIHSIEGGCPARGQSGNFPDPPGGIEPNLYPDPDKYSYSIPQGISPGTYTLAWTWFNKIGNREMYMNCASVKISGGSNKKTRSLKQRQAASFPSMFTANIGNGCTTAEGGDLKFPDPGASVETNPGYIPMAPVGNCPAASSDSSDSGSNSSAPPSGSSSVSSGTSAAPSTMAVVTPVSSTSSPSATPTTTSSVIGAPSAPSSRTSSTGPSTSSCSTPGQSICSPDGTEIGTCSQAGTVTWIKLTPGTKCSGGNIVGAKLL